MVKDEVIRLRISAEDKATIQAAGAISLLGASGFMLDASLKAARKAIEEAKAKRLPPTASMAKSLKITNEALMKMGKAVATKPKPKSKPVATTDRKPPIRGFWSNPKKK